MTQSVIEMLRGADLDEMQGQLATLETELETSTQKLRAEISTLKAAIGLVERLQKGETPPVSRKKKDRVANVGTARRPSGLNGPTVQDRAKTYLEAAGESSIQAIAAGISYENVSYLNSRLMDDARFTKSEKGLWKLRS